MPFKYAWIALGVLGAGAGIAIAAVGLVPSSSEKMREKGMGAVVKPTDSQFPPVTPGAPSIGARIRSAKLQAIEMTIVSLQHDGVDIDPSLVRQAMDDGPSVEGYINYASMPRVVSLSRMDRDDPIDMDVACFAESSGYGTGHMIVKSDGTRALLRRSNLYSWIVSGCADAIRTRGRQMNRVQVQVTLRDLLPDTPEYAEMRREILTQLNSKPVRRYQTRPDRLEYPVRSTHIRPTRIRPTVINPTLIRPTELSR
ncbi:hypothetical protein [Asticcacaulis benevestitus]|uniref:Uncharacterized protein n=1 Tax=Asticcacaulis benevestitus DSM 16100 = ATCC BAA-896 TaxID=1121022 RepID=V4REC6_9CAUL|nr:hypothetical protein [Asticcacaulis benevestitus]ESQ89738.1 hypothetical protein ABENE_13415 [Asticcacaulis benevestitus DSM 16100 = ATCC BAA-896]